MLMTLISGAPALTTGPGRPLLAMAIAASVGLAGCATRPKVPQPLRAPVTAEGAAIASASTEAASADRGNGVVLNVPEEIKPDPGLTTPVKVPDILFGRSHAPVSLVLDGVPLTTFIDVVFGNELKLPISIDASVRTRSDLVSLRMAQPQSHDELYRSAVETLRNYGVVAVESGGVIRFSMAQGILGVQSPYMSTRDASRLPSGGNRIYVTVPLVGRTPGSIAGQLRAIYSANPSISITEMTDRSALLVAGPADGVREVVQAINELDPVPTRDSGSLQVQPRFVSTTTLARDLKEVLQAQGYTVKEGPQSTGILRFVLLGSSNTLAIFSESRAALEAARYWAEALDRPNSADEGIGGVYVYAPRHTPVQSLMPVLTALVGGTSAAQQPTAAVSAIDRASTGTTGDTNAPRTQATAQAASTASGEGGKLAADPVRNLLIFQGDEQRWRAIQGVLAKLDVPARQVVIEVTVAEVTLTDEFANGIEWAIRNINVNGMSGPLNLFPGTGGGSTTGLLWRALSSSGQVSAVINLFAKDSRVTILSTPRVMVKSGEHANIDVGQEVPIITSQATLPDLPTTGGTSSILQNVQYRKTGVLLDVQPMVHSSDRVDLVISQEVSEASENQISSVPSPTILSRKLQTSLSLADGQAMLLGGLISNTRSDGKTKVPLLGDIPVVGALFQQRRRTGIRTELVMLIRPYIITDTDQGRAITDAVRTRFETGKQGARAEDFVPGTLRAPTAEPLPTVPAKSTEQP